MLDFNEEFNAGVRDATKDIERHGLERALYLLEGPDTEDPYIQGYASVVERYQ